MQSDAQSDAARRLYPWAECRPMSWRPVTSWCSVRAVPCRRVRVASWRRVRAVAWHRLRAVPWRRLRVASWRRVQAMAWRRVQAVAWRRVRVASWRRVRTHAPMLLTRRTPVPIAASYASAACGPISLRHLQAAPWRRVRDPYSGRRVRTAGSQDQYQHQHCPCHTLSQ